MDEMNRVKRENQDTTRISQARKQTMLTISSDSRGEELQASASYDFRAWV